MHADMAGPSRPKAGVASARLCPVIHVSLAASGKDVDARHPATPRLHTPWLAEALAKAARPGMTEHTIAISNRLRNRPYCRSSLVMVLVSPLPVTAKLTLSPACSASSDIPLWTFNCSAAPRPPAPTLPSAP